MISRGFVKFGLATSITLGLLLLASFSVAWGLSSITRDIEGSILFLFSWFGTLLGWLLASREIKSTSTALIAIFTSLIILLIFYSRTITAFSNTLTALNSIINKSLLESSPVLDELPLLVNNLKNLGQAFSEPFIHLVGWLNKFLKSETAYDPMLPRIFWSILVCLAALWTGYDLRRRQEPLIAMTPNGLILAGSLNYVHGEISPLLLYMGVTLILIPLLHYKKREQTWMATHTDYAEDIVLDIHLVVIPIIGFLLLIGTFSPLISIRQILRIGQKIYHSYEQKAVSAGELLGMESQPELSNDYPTIRAGGLPRQHLLGSGPELNEQLVMIIRVDDPSIAYSADKQLNPPRYYWRSVIYDQYTGTGWETSPTESLSYRRGESLFENPPSSTQGIQVVVQDVQRIQSNSELLYTSGMILKADHAFRIERRITKGDNYDLFAGIIEANEYRVESLLTQFSDDKLSNSQGEIPAWVLERYLQLPSSLPERVRNLAQDITRTQNITYEKALAIEAYLRQYPYSLQISKPPSGRDVADYFLFDLRMGYCDYYATAMVVLARSVGIPARLVIGYASGTYDNETSQYYVTEANAHSWPELYLPGAGWVEFEPTGGRPMIQRPNLDSSTSEIMELIPAKKFVLSDFLKRMILKKNYPLIIIFMSIFGIGLWLFHHTIRLRTLPPKKSIVYAFQQLHRQAAALTQPNYQGDTPNEFAAKLQARLQDISGSRRVREVVPKGSKEVQDLIDIYNLSKYSSQRMGKIEKERSIGLWWRLHWQISILKFKYKLTNIVFLVIIRRIK